MAYAQARLCVVRTDHFPAGPLVSYSELRREKAWSRIHLVPLLMAEADRDTHRREQAQLAREKEIMKDVKGWQVSDGHRTCALHVALRAPPRPIFLPILPPSTTARQERVQHRTIHTFEFRRPLGFDHKCMPSIRTAITASRIHDWHDQPA